MTYIYIDGDNIGLKIEQSFLNNNEDELSVINLSVIKAIEQISSNLKTSGQVLLFAGADGVISKGNLLDIKKLLESIRAIDSDFTFSIGVGNSLRDCYIALRYAKSVGKNIAIDYSDGRSFKVIK
ncbi:mCpol domain-containing protein [Pontibacter sp. KCTC 32443]|uniref:mCpol domain-containing protein n=1 Tax=Pontibacter TaxID=323449 RepID=UPI00164DB9A7|nr:MULTISPECIES: mCpol domain-containing protein [Pontibacter]MBC5773145.1 mCpol domain-containing protein [Pontibacter sp. KCTC 32443]